mmetsp:Transcript_65515/g.211274  ORF Transcript_65515/g.211274 Transcript_65515/m.211274 type:complete len:162 (+) Transcript_65515:61-546(+)
MEACRVGHRGQRGAAGRLMLLVAVAAVALLRFSGGQAFTMARPGWAAQQPSRMQLRAAKEAEVVSDVAIEETEDNAKIGAGAISFVAGLFFPLLGSFNFGLLLGALGYGTVTGNLSGFLAKQQGGQEYVGTADKAQELLLKAGETGVKVANFAAAKAKELQ